jgi:hypothetical protein
MEGAIGDDREPGIEPGTTGEVGEEAAGLLRDHEERCVIPDVPAGLDGDVRDPAGDGERAEQVVRAGPSTARRQTSEQVLGAPFDRVCSQSSLTVASASRPVVETCSRAPLR